MYLDRLQKYTFPLLDGNQSNSTYYMQTDGQTGVTKLIGSFKMCLKQRKLVEIIQKNEDKKGKSKLC
jgi:hypothetical protein